MTPDALARQIRSARAWLNWTREDLANRASVVSNTIASIEKGDGSAEPNARTLAKIMSAFEQAGVEMTDDGGVRPRLSRVSYFTGRDGFHRFFDDVYETVKGDPDADVCIANNDEAQFQKWHSEHDAAHVARMAQLKKPRYKVLMKENVYCRDLDYCEFRWVKDSQFADTCVYIYGGKTAFIDFEPDNVIVTLVDSSNVSSALRRMFESTWQNSTPIGKTA